MAVSGVSGRKMAAKKGSLTPAQSKGPLRVSPPETFLGARCSSLPLRYDVDLRAAVGLGVVLIAEAAGPADEGADGGAVAGDLDVGVEDVGLVEGEGLGDLVVAVGVFEGKGRGSGEVAGGRGDVEALLRLAVRGAS